MDNYRKGGRRTAAPLAAHRRGEDVHPMSQGLIVSDKGRATFILQDTPRVEVRVALVDWGKKGIVLEVMGVQCKLIVHPLTANNILIDSNNE